MGKECKNRRTRHTCGRDPLGDLMVAPSHQVSVRTSEHAPGCALGVAQTSASLSGAGDASIGIFRRPWRARHWERRRNCGWQTGRAWSRARTARVVRAQSRPACETESRDWWKSARLRRKKCNQGDAINWTRDNVAAFALALRARDSRRRQNDRDRSRALSWNDRRRRRFENVARRDRVSREQRQANAQRNRGALDQIWFCRGIEK